MPTLAVGESTCVACVQQHLAARAVTRSQTTAVQRVNARFGKYGSCRNLLEGLEPVEFNGLSKVCMAVSIRAVAVQRDVMNRNWNAMKLEMRRKKAARAVETRIEASKGA